MNKLKGMLLTGLLIFSLSPGMLSAVDVLSSIINPAQDLKGAPYVYGNEGPRSFDCSGLIYFLYKPLLPTIPRSSRDYLHYGKGVSINELKPGDLLLFATTGDPGRVSHVAIYIGQDSVIHAVSNGPQTGVIVSSINSGYWQRKFHSARRVFDFPVSSASGSTSVTVDYERGRYTGPLKEGEPAGQGRMVLNNGDTYEGEFRDGLFHGQGTYSWKDGKSYTGRFINGEMAASVKAPAEEPTYMEKQDNPWNDWDGEVYGDYTEWRNREQSAFEAFKARDKAGSADR